MYTHCVNQAAQAAVVTEWIIDANRAVELLYIREKKMTGRGKERIIYIF